MLMIMSSGRSGSTWLGKLFDSHPDVLYLHEPDSVMRPEAFPYLPITEDIETYKDEVRVYLEHLLKHRSAKTVGRPPVFPKSWRATGATRYYELLTLAARAVGRVPLPGMRRIPVPQLMKKNMMPYPVIKTVSSGTCVSLYAAAKPDMRFLHLIRHPCAVVASSLRGVEQGVMPGNPFLKKFFAMPEAVHYPLAYDDFRKRPLAEQLAFSWMISNDKMAADAHMSGHATTVYYDDLCRDPLNGMAELFEFAGLDFAPQSREFISALLGANSEKASYFSVMRPPTASLDKWKTALSEEQQAAIFDIVRHARTDAVKNSVS